MKKIAMIVDMPSDAASAESVFSRIAEDFSLLNMEVCFYGENPAGLVKPLSELESFYGTLIDLRGNAHWDPLTLEKELLHQSKKNPENNKESEFIDPVRVAVDIRSASLWDVSQQGIGRNLREQIRALKKYNDKIKLTLLYDREVGAADDIRRMGFPLKPFEEFRPEDFDLIHLTDPLSKAERFSLLPDNVGDLGVICNFYDTIPMIFDKGYFSEYPERKRHYYQRIEEIVERVESYLTISEASQKDMVKYMNLDPQKIIVMKAGVDEKYFLEQSRQLDDESKSILNPGKPYILYVGSHDYRKRVDLLIRAFNRIHREMNGGIQLALAGFYLPGFENFFPRMGAEPDVIPDIRLLRFVPEESLIHLYQNAIALVFPSLYEGFGLPVVEAMACGCPVAAFDTSSIPEVTDGAAMLVRSGDYNELAEAALKLIKDEKLRQSLAAKGKIQARKFTWDKVADKTAQAYFKLYETVKKRRDGKSAVESTPVQIHPAEADSDDKQEPTSEQALKNGDPRDLKVTVEGVFLDKSGYALHSRNMALGLDQLGADVKLNMLWYAGAPDIQLLEPDAPREEGAIYLTQQDGSTLKYVTPVEPKKAGRILELIQREREPEGRTFIACLPADSPKDHIFKRIRETTKGFERYIGYTMFEMADLPRGWVEGCDCMDEIWVPSHFNLESFTRAGVPPGKIRIVPLGVEAELFDPEKTQPMQIPGTKGFNFLSIFQWTKRKGWDILLKAYLKAFTQEDDVALVIRSYYHEGKEVEGRIREYIQRLGYNIDKIPRISVVSQPVSSDHMPSLYNACQAFVLPTRGEGWGLPYMEAMAMGMPVIGTRFSAHLEFMNGDNSYLIDNLGTELVDEEQVIDSPLYLGTSWGIPSLDHTAELMRHVYENGSEAAERGRRARKDILEKWTVKNQVLKTAEVLLKGSGGEDSAPSAETISLSVEEKFDSAPAIISSIGDKPLRVAMQNRPQTFSAPGGDTVVMQELKRELENMGLRMEYLFKIEDLKDFDLVHTFNFALSDMIKLYAENAERQRKPFIITPMYEDWPRFINPSFKLYYFFKEYIEKDQPRDAFDEIISPLKRLKPHHRADNSFNVRLAGGITPSGPSEAERINADYPYARNVVPVYLGCDLPAADIGPELFIKETGLKDFVLSVARIETRKNQLMLLKALEDEDIPLVLVSGGYTYQMPYLELCRKFKRRGQTFLLDRLSDEMLVSAYMAAKVHALPSWYELPGMVSVEAAHYDCNVVASPWGTVEDYLGDYGYYAEPDDPEALRRAVLKAMKDPVNPALKEHVKRFTWKKAAQTTLEVYHKILSEHREVAGFLQEANRLRTGRDKDGALDYFGEALKVHPDNREAMSACKDILSLKKDPRASEISSKLNAISREREKKCMPHIPQKLEDKFVFEEFDDIDEAFELLKNGALHQAEARFKEALEQDENNHRALLGMGKIEFHRGKYESARGFLEKAADIKTNGKNLIDLAAAMEKLNQCDKALRLLERIKELPDVNGDFDFDINRLKGHCLLKKGNYEEAEACYLEALKIDRGSEKPYLGLGSLELLRGNFAGAENNYKTALELNPQSDKAHLALAIMYLETGKADEALEKVTRALDINIENQQAVMTCLKAAHMSGKLGAAEKYLNRYTELHPANTEILYSLAGVRYKIGDREGALEAARKVLIFKPDHEPAAELIERLE